MEESNVSSGELTFIHQQAFIVDLKEAVITETVVVLSTSLFFIYMNGIMFFTLRSKPTFRETSRYMLFANVVFNDSIHLLSSTVLYLLSLAYFHLIKVICALIIMISAVTFATSPLNLAVMSLERYVAICFPLRHAEITTQRRTGIAIGVVWFLSSLNYLIDLFYTAITNPHPFTTEVLCSRQQLLIAKWQVDSANGFNSLYFVAVAVIIIYSYVGIIVTARSVSTGKDSARKARKTVLLHLIQLGLCLTSFLYGIIERIITTGGVALFRRLRIVNFFTLIILPRCLSPLIYGLRDETFRPFYLAYFRCRMSNVKPAAILH